MSFLIKKNSVKGVCTTHTKLLNSKNYPQPLQTQKLISKSHCLLVLIVQSLEQRPVTEVFIEKVPNGNQGDDDDNDDDDNDDDNDEVDESNADEDDNDGNVFSDFDEDG